MSKYSPTTTSTEARAEHATALDAAAPDGALKSLLEGQIAAAGAVSAAIPPIRLAADAVAKTINRGGSLIYVGAGSSGLMAIADGLD